MWIYAIIIFLICINIYYPRVLARYILYLLGWGELSIQFRDIFNRYDKLVVIYPHTSYWDSIFMTFYRLAFPEVLGDLVFLVRPDFLDIPLLGRFLKNIGGVGASCVHKKNGGRTDAIIDYLNKKGKFHLAISPKGTIKKAPWKNGYYYITKGTEAKITVVGYDYIKKDVRIFLPQNDTDKLLPQDELENWLKYRMKLLSEGQKNPQNVEY